MSKPESTTPIRDAFEEVWKHNPNPGDDENKESAFCLFMAGAHTMLFVVPAKAKNLIESLDFVRVAREEVEAYVKVIRKKEAERN